MTQLAIAFEDGRRSFAPGEAIRGRALWLLDEPPERIEVRLFWHTSGKGDTDIEVVAVAGFDAPGAAGDRTFELRLPAAPWSFSGKLVSLTWALEIVALPDEQCERFDVVIAPGGTEVRFGAVDRS